MYMPKFILVLTVVVLVNGNACAELIFSAPPRGPEADERATYEPLAQAMSNALGEEVRYVYPRDFNEYSFDMRKGRYDIVFDGPHFAQWRVTNLDHTILANLPEHLQFMVIAPVTKTRINSLRDLVYETVCAQMTPQLGTLMLLQNYYERAVEPQLNLVRGEDKVLAEFTSGKCTAAVLRDKTFLKMSEADRAAYKVIYKTALAPNDAITTSKNVTAKQRTALVALLTNPETARAASPIFNRFSKKADAFDVADPEEFVGYEELLQLSLGWDAK
jgi:ABC-type phosphate/phosphonate transport system substrate-binding protein